MNCDGVRPLLSAYIDGELSGGELLRVQQHLRRCHWCAGEVDALRQTIALVTSLDEVEPPATFHAELHQRLVAAEPPLAVARKAQRHSARRVAFGRWAIPAAAAAALVIGVAGLNRSVLPVPVAQPPQQENVVALPTGQVSQSGSPGTAAPPAFSGGADQPVPVSAPGDETPSGAGGPVDSSNTTAPVTSPGGSPSGAGASGNPDAPVTVPGQDEPGTQGSPLGPTNPGSGVSVVTVDNEPGASAGLPSRQHLKASLEVAVADPARAAQELKGRLTMAKEIREETRASVVELQVTVAAADFAAAVEQVEAQFRSQNAAAKLEPVELSSQLDEVEQRIAALEALRADLMLRLEGATDPKTLEVGAMALANYDRELEELQASYQNLLDSLENGEIQIVFKPELSR